MALFRLTRIVEPEPRLRGDGLYLRPAAAPTISPGRVARGEPRFSYPVGADLARRRSDPRRLSPPLRRQAEEIGARRILSVPHFRRATEALLGGLTLGGMRRGVAQTATLGYWMGAPYAGKGVMTRAVGVVGRWAFLAAPASPRGRLPAGKHRLPRCWSATAFQREGLARSYLKINGAWRDHLLYGLLETRGGARLV